MSNKQQLQENNETLATLVEQLAKNPTAAELQAEVNRLKAMVSENQAMYFDESNGTEIPLYAQTDIDPTVYTSFVAFLPNGNFILFIGNDVDVDSSNTSVSGEKNLGLKIHRFSFSWSASGYTFSDETNSGFVRVLGFGGGVG